MIPLLTILLVAIGYALIRAKHDSFLSHGTGSWKTWAFIEGIFVSLVVVLLSWKAFNTDWWLIFHLGMIFAFVFWIVFDCTQGWIRTRNILHIGDQGFDAKMRAMFFYDKPLLWWKNTGAFRLLFFRLFWLGILIPSYFSLLHTYC